mgnify:CR=1 FL=1
MPGAQSTAVEPSVGGLVTLTTCHPQFSNAERLIIHAVRTDEQPKDPGAGLPAAIKEVR